MTFHWPHAFWLLLLPVGFAIAELSRRVRSASSAHPKIMRAEASPAGLNLVAHNARNSGPRVRWRLWLGLILVIAAFARPQYGEVEEPVFEQAREILIAVDLSRSMLAPDVAPSRLERSKLLITSLLERLKGERVGLIVFAGTAFLQSPLSADYEILREFLPALTTDYLPAGGTEYAALLDTALDAFSEESGADRFLIVLSDGESQTEAWQNRIDAIRERDIRVLSLGIGTAEGAMLPDGVGGFVKDERGAVVLSRLNHSTLEELARRSGGMYRDASAWVDLADLLRQTVEAGQQGEFVDQKSARRIERFQWALAPGLLILLWSLWREFPVQPRHRAITIKAKRATSGTVGLSLFLCACLGPSNDALAVELAQPPPATPAPGSQNTPPEPPNFEAPLNELITRLANQPTVDASEFAEVANNTLAYGQSLLGAGQKPLPSVVHDALEAVDVGEIQDATAADWPTLRAELKKLLEDPEEEQQDQQDEDQEEKEDGDEGDEGEKGDQGDEGEDGDQGQDGEQGENGDQGEEGQSGENEKPGDQGEQDGEGQDGDQPQDPSEQKGENQDDANPSQEERTQQPSESAFGDLDEPQEAPEPSEQRPEPQQQGNQQIGGQQTQSNEAQQNPELAVPLQKLDQLKQQDSPAQLYQLMQDPTAQPPQTGRDW